MKCAWSYQPRRTARSAKSTPGSRLDLQRRLLQPVAAQHPLHRHADIAPEHPLGGAGTPRRKPHDLLHPMQTFVVANPSQRLSDVYVGSVSPAPRRSRRRARAADALSSRDSLAHRTIASTYDPSGQCRSVATETGGETAGPEPRADHGAALADRGAEDPARRPVNKGVRQREAVARAVAAPFVGEVQRRESDHRVGERFLDRADPSLTDQKCSTKRAADSDGAHRSRSNIDVEAARPTTPRSGATCDSSCPAAMHPGNHGPGRRPVLTSTAMSRAFLAGPAGRPRARRYPRAVANANVECPSGWEFGPSLKLLQSDGWNGHSRDRGPQCRRCRGRRPAQPGCAVARHRGGRQRRHDRRLRPWASTMGRSCTTPASSTRPPDL